jgi:hypothetical protein
MTHQYVTAKFPTKPDKPPPEEKAATPVASRSGGPEKQVSSNTRTYNALTLPDKAALAADLIADKQLRASDKVVVLALLFRFHNTKTGQCNPAYKKLAESCCFTRRAVIKAIPRLEAAARVMVDRTSGGRNRRNQFRFVVRKAETAASETSINTKTVNAEARNSEQPFTPEGEPAFTRKEPGNLIAGKKHRNVFRSSESFDRFWSVYPKKVSKRGAQRIFERLLKKGEVRAADLINGAERYAEQCREHGTQPRFIKHPTTWLNAGCWDDEPALVGCSTNSEPPTT